jgi:hypothetical protein
MGRLVAPVEVLRLELWRSEMLNKEDSVDLSCTFCGKSQRDVRKLIAGPTVYICDECIKKCNDIFAEEAKRMELAPERTPSPPKEQKGAKKPKQTLCCSFCGKSQKEVKKLIAGPTVYICDECIGLCNDIIAEELDRTETAAAPRVTVPQNALSPIAGILKRGLLAATRILDVLMEQVTDDLLTRVAHGEPRNERIWGPWQLASDWRHLHKLVKRQASDGNEAHRDDGLAAMPLGPPSDTGETSDVGAPVIEHLSATLQVLELLARRVEQPDLEELRPSVELARERLHEARELLLADRAKSSND